MLKVMAIPRREICYSFDVFTGDLMIESGKFLLMARAERSMLDLIAMFPLFPREVVKVGGQSNSPFLGRRTNVESVIMALLK